MTQLSLDNYIKLEKIEKMLRAMALEVTLCQVGIQNPQI